MSEIRNYKKFDDVDIFSGVDADSGTLDFVDNKGTSLDGIYRPKVTDKKNGFEATIRFLPNLQRDGKIGPSAIERHQHYADLKSHTELAAYYDCMKNFTDKCDLCTMYWKLKNSKNATDNDKAAMIGRSTKYYSYVLIVEDKQNKDLEGKVMIFTYGYKIKEKIKAQRDGKYGDPCNIFDLANGKDFKLIIKIVGEYPNYDDSAFLDAGPIKLVVNGVAKKAPVTVDPKTGKSKITDAKVREKIQSVIFERKNELEDHLPKEWTTEDRFKVSQVLEVLQGNDIIIAERQAQRADDISTQEPDDEGVFGSESPTSTGDFFDVDEVK